MIVKKSYPTHEELKKQGEYLSKVPQKVYELFERQGIPPTVRLFIKRTSPKKLERSRDETDRRTD